MDFYLVENMELKIRARRGAASASSIDRRKRERKPDRHWISLRSAVPSITISEDDRKTGYCDYLITALVENTDELKQRLKPECIKQYLQLRFVAPSYETWGQEKGIVWICGVDDPRPADGKSTSIFTRLKSLYGVENVKVNLKVSDFKSFTDQASSFHFEARDLPIKPVGPKGEECGSPYEELNFHTGFRDAWFQGKEFSGMITISITVSHEVVNKLFGHKFTPLHFTVDSRRALEEGICADLSIVAGNGAQVKCHKVYLSVRSSVFKAMFESEMKETATNSIEMADMSEDGVHAFLAFIYHWDLLEASKSCDIALELFQAGHKYDISDLTESMQQLMLAKPREWFTVDVAVKLFIFTKNLGAREEGDPDEFRNLLNKSVQVLKWYSKTAYEKLRDSVEYRQLFEKNPKAAMDPTTYFLMTTFDEIPS